MMFLKFIFALCLVIAIIKLLLKIYLPIMSDYGIHINFKYIQIAWKIFNFKTHFHDVQFALMRQSG